MINDWITQYWQAIIIAITIDLTVRSSILSAESINHLQTNTSRLYRKRIATSTLKRHRVRRTVELVAALGTRADLHRRRLRLPRLQELQSLHAQRVVGNVHQTVIMRRHPSLERGRNSYQFCDRWKNSRRLLHTPWSKGL